MDRQDNQFENNQNNQNNQNYNNPYGYNNSYGYNPVPGKPPRKSGNGFGVASLILGIVSLLLFCTCINWLTAILAIIFGIIQVVQYKEKGLAIGGIITAIVSLLFTIILYTLVWVGMIADGYSESFDYFDSYDTYYDDEYYDDDNYEEMYDINNSGNEFLSGMRIYF